MDLIDFLVRCGLFRNMSSENIKKVINETGIKVRDYNDGDVLVKSGSFVKDIGIVISGEVLLYEGKVLKSGDVFGISAAAVGAVNIYDVQAAGESKAAYINYGKLIKCAGKEFAGFHRVVENLTGLIADENIKMYERLAALTQSNLRSKLLEYFKIQRVLHGGSVLSPGMSRYEIANYLCVDRCSLSRELTKLKNEGIIETDKQKIILKHKHM